jgi:hypothetical protein
MPYPLEATSLRALRSTEPAVQSLHYASMRVASSLVAAIEGADLHRTEPGASPVLSSRAARLLIANLTPGGELNSSAARRETVSIVV